MKRVLILGGGVMQLPSIRTAKAKGWRVTVADADPGAIGRGLCDEFALVDLKDRDGILRLATSIAPDGVFTAGTDFSSSVAWVSERLGLPGIGYDTAMRATDKCLMREAFERAGVPSPKFACWTPGVDPAEAAADIAFPLVVKPVDNMGARGVIRVDSPAELRAACEKAVGLSRSSRAIIEEYMEGRELSLDAIVYRGEITVCGVADRHIRFEPCFVEMGHTMPTDLPEGDRRAVEDVFSAGIRAIGIDNGAAKGDIKLTPSGPKVGEIAARLSGGYMSGWTFPFSCGVEVTEAALNVAVGLPPGDLRPKFAAVCAERALISIPGFVEEVSGVKEAAAAVGVREVFLRVKPGNRVVFPANNVEKCGNVIAVRPSRQEASTAAATAISLIRIRLRPREEETDRFLFSRTDAARWPAFELARGSDADAVRVMRPYFGKMTGAAGNGPISVLTLPESDRENCVDWHQMPFREQIRMLTESGKIRMRPSVEDGKFVLGSLFWNAFLRGGIQGALYLLDGLGESAGKETAAEYLERISR